MSVCVWVNVGVELEFNFYKLQNLIENCFEKISTSGSETPLLSQALSLSVSLSLSLSCSLHLFVYFGCVCVVLRIVGNLWNVFLFIAI